MHVFVNRKEELRLLMSYIDSKIDIVVYGLRGIGKTSLLEELKRRLESIGRDVILINGYAITSHKDVGVLIGSDVVDPRILLSELFLRDRTVIIIDEFTAFLRVFVGKRAFPSIKRTAMFLRTLIEKRRKRGGESIILCSSAIGLVRRLTRKYFAPLFRQLKMFHLEPMSLKDARKLAENLCAKFSSEVVELVRGVPFYIVKMCEEINIGKTPLEALEYLLADPSGDLNIYFQGLYEKLSPPERYILHLIARGVSRFSKISERATFDISIYLKRLQLSDIIKKIKKGPKEAYYEIKDPVFKAWLAIQEVPSLGKMSIKSLMVSSLSFEAMVREMFREITTIVEIEDFLGRKVRIEPARVIRYSKDKIDIDALLIRDSEAIVVECHFWGPAKGEKIGQLLDNAKYVEQNIGLKVKDRILISYFGFDERTIELAKEKNIKLLSATQLREIQKKTKKKWGF